MLVGQDLLGGLDGDGEIADGEVGTAEIGIDLAEGEEDGIQVTVQVDGTWGMVLAEVPEEGREMAVGQLVRVDVVDLVVAVVLAYPVEEGEDNF